jgi:hypothetical protein
MVVMVTKHQNTRNDLRPFPFHPSREAKSRSVVKKKTLCAIADRPSPRRGPSGRMQRSRSCTRSWTVRPCAADRPRLRREHRQAILSSVWRLDRHQHIANQPTTEQTPQGRAGGRPSTEQPFDMERTTRSSAEQPHEAE